MQETLERRAQKKMMLEVSWIDDAKSTMVLHEK
jgi:hypothetical protein